MLRHVHAHRATAVAHGELVLAAQLLQRVGLERLVQLQRRRPAQLTQQPQQVRAMAAGLALRARRAYACQRLGEAGFLHRLEQVIGGRRFEGADRVVIVGGDEHHQRHLVRGNAAQRFAGWLATTALIGGTAALIANFLSLSIVIAVFVLRDDMSPELARALQDVDGAGHLVQLLPLGVFVLFASAAALVTRTLGRVLSWAGIAVGATSIVVLAATGLPADEEFFIWPFLLVVLWMAVISLRLGFARGRAATPAAVEATDG